MVYSVFYILGTLLSMQVIVVKYRPVQTSEHMTALGAFIIVQVMAALRYSNNLIFESESESMEGEVHSDHESKCLVRIQERWAALQSLMLQRSGAAILAVCGLAWAYGATLDWWDPPAAQGPAPLHANSTWPPRGSHALNKGPASQPSMWANYFYDLHILLPLTPVGLYFCFEQVTDAKVFVITYTVAAAYFSGFMVRMVLFLCPVVCICAGIGLSSVLKARTRDLAHRDPCAARSPDHSVSAAAAAGSPPSRLPRPVAALTVAALGWLLMLFVQHSVWCAGEAPALAAEQAQARSRWVAEDYREGRRWMAENLPRGGRVLAWPDCGFRLSAVGNHSLGAEEGEEEEGSGASLLVDSCCSEESAPWPLLARTAGCNGSLAADVSSALFLAEGAAWAALRRLDVEWVLLLLGGDAGHLLDPAQQALPRAGAAKEAATAPQEAVGQSGPDAPAPSRDGGGREALNNGEDAEGGGAHRGDSAASSDLRVSLVYKLANLRCCPPLPRVGLRLRPARRIPAGPRAASVAGPDRCSTIPPPCLHPSLLPVCTRLVEHSARALPRAAGRRRQSAVLRIRQPGPPETGPPARRPATEGTRRASTRSSRPSACSCGSFACAAAPPRAPAPARAVPPTATAERWPTAAGPPSRGRAPPRPTARSACRRTTAAGFFSGRSACPSRRLGPASGARPRRWRTAAACRSTGRASRPGAPTTPPPPGPPPGPPARRRASAVPRRRDSRAAAGATPRGRAAGGRGAASCA